ncbi:hypothetical protein EXS57_03790 [Candidatus Kaiserbacteria bacterium]|nr:hypothetical protein [Candidatus Kaiserbacteria bacterium]
MNFGTAMRGQNFSTDAIHRWFGKLVNLDDYERRDKRAILKHLVALTRAEGNRNAATNASMESESAVAGT